MGLDVVFAVVELSRSPLPVAVAVVAVADPVEAPLLLFLPVSSTVTTVEAVTLGDFEESELKRESCLNALLMLLPRFVELLSGLEFAESLVPEISDFAVPVLASKFDLSEFIVSKLSPCSEWPVELMPVVSRTLAFLQSYLKPYRSVIMSQDVCFCKVGGAMLGSKMEVISMDLGGALAAEAVSSEDPLSVNFIEELLSEFLSGVFSELWSFLSSEV